MTWIKTNFLWMMIRCGWASKPNQECVLAITLRRPFFERILALSEGTTTPSRPLADQESCTKSDVLLQLGLRGEVRDEFASGRQIVGIEDITPFVREMRERAVSGNSAVDKWNNLLVPLEGVLELDDEYQSTDTQDDYYSLLGVAPNADVTQIKRAYRGLMREYHPDMSQDEDSTEFAIFLNDVYETLIDPERRAAYDAIAGFKLDAINPFLDTSYERDMVFVDEFTCIGCRNCANVCPKTFDIEDEYGRARVMAQGVDGDERLQEAIDTCPVSCIHWVSAPQLALLEKQMSKMERVAAWLLMTGGGKGTNLSVFVEASMAWEKRQSEIRARMQRASSWFSWSPSMGAQAYANQEQAAKAAAEAGNGNGGGGEVRAFSKGATAASVAAAARKWRDFQRRKRNKAESTVAATEGTPVPSSQPGAAEDTADLQWPAAVSLYVRLQQQ
ncbi:hypothetical protein N2152v2_001708 [Parachlorella kessleri]